VVVDLALQRQEVAFGVDLRLRVERQRTQLEVLVGGRSLALWPNAVAFVVAGALSFWLWRLSYRGDK
jgi:hypothetical protein